MDIKQRIHTFIKYKGISIKKFEEQCELSNGYISSMRKGFGADKLNNVLNIFPDLNREWLLYGEGEMLNPQNAITNSPVGDNSTQIAGNSNHINCSSTIDKALNEISEMRKLLAEAIRNNKEQADRFFSIIEGMTK